MPELSLFKKSTVLYLRGEASNYIYLIKTGTIVLSYGVDTEHPRRQVIGKGEFFGLFSAIGHYPRQADAVANSDIELLIFDEKEFEHLVGKNKKLSLQFMNMLSKELRLINKKVKEILQTRNSIVTGLDTGMYNYIKMYEKQNDTKKIVYIAKKFIETHPTSKNFDEVKDILHRFENTTQ